MDNMTTSQTQIRQETRSLLKTFFPLLAGIALQSLLALTVNLVDNFMLGSYSETAMSGAALANQLQYMLQQFLAGTGAGVSVLGAQYWGKKDIAPIRKIISIGLRFSIAVGFIFFALTSLFPRQLLGLLTDSQPIIDSAAEYLGIMRWTYLLYSVSALLVFSLQSVETAFIGTLMSAMTIGINASLNYLLIFGHGGAPEMGIRGAAIATLVSRSVELVTIILYLRFFDRKLNLRMQDFLHTDRTYLGDYFHTALPIMLSGLMWGVAQTAQTAILGHISPAAIAANSIASIFFQLFSAFGMACANASSVMIGKCVGQDNLALVKSMTKALQLIFLAFGSVSGLCLFLCRNALISFYTLQPETRELTLTFMTIQSIAMVGSCYEYPVAGGIVAGGGNTKFVAIMDNVFMWLYTIPVSALSAFVLHWPPAVTFALLKSDQLLKCIPNGLYTNTYRWVHNLTR